MSAVLRRKRTLWAWIFLAPTLLALAVVAGFPLLQTFWYSLTDATLDNLASPGFLGLENYHFLFTEPAWWKAVWNTLVFTFWSVSLETLLGLAIALLLAATFPGRGLLRAAILVPWAIPTVVSSRIWEWLYQDQYGFFNAILERAGMAPIAFLGDPRWSMPVIVAVDVWKTTPFMALLLLAGLGTIPRELYEASRMDGASPLKRFFTITLPLLKPTLAVALIFRALDALRVFDLIYVMQGSSEETASMSIFARQQMIDFQEIGMGSSASFSIFVLISILIFVYLSLMKVDFSR